MRWPVPVLLLVVACDGPPASDAALCRDVAHRICNSECIFQQNDIQAPANDCEGTLNARTGCDDEGFKFQNRQTFLSCRLSLLHDGDDVDVSPKCEDIDDLYAQCPQVKDFYRPR